MNTPTNPHTPFRAGTRTIRLSRAALALLALPLALSAGCGDELQREFRQAAAGSIETGVNSIADGIITGVFAIVEPDNTTTSGTSTNSANSSTTGGASTSDTNGTATG